MPGGQTCLVFPSCPQSLYVCLPALLECPPFQTECRESWCSASPLPEETRRVVSVYQATLDLLRQFQVHPEIASQVLAYLFFFSGTLLFNQLLDKGEAGGWGPAQALPGPFYPRAPWLGAEGGAQRSDVVHDPACCPPDSPRFWCQLLPAGGPAQTRGDESGVNLWPLCVARVAFPGWSGSTGGL